MEITKKYLVGSGVRFSLKKEGKEVARAYLYFLKNDLHKNPLGYVEDVFVDESFREKGCGTRLVKSLIEEARKMGCYKLIAGSRYSRKEAHRLYEKLGFKKHGIEFRMDL